MASFMSVLKAIGHGFVKVMGQSAPIIATASTLASLGVFGGFGPLIISILSRVIAVEQFAQTIQTEFNMPGLTGPQKLQSILPQVVDEVMQLDIVKHATGAVDTQGITDGTTLLVNGVVKILNSIGSGIPAVPKAPGA